jgi:hypothetical protein
MTATEIKDCTLEATRIISESLRDQDEVEVYLLTGKPNLEALVASVEASRYTKVLYLGGNPAAIFGLGHLSDEVGVPWMVGTQEMVKHSRAWLKLAPAMRDFFHQHYPTLTNVVHEKNTRSIRWLSKLGFSFNMAPIPSLPGFIQFTRTINV